MKKLKITSILILILIVGSAITQFEWPLPKITVTLAGASHYKTSGNLALSMPKGGQSGVAATDIGLISATANEQKTPIASLTKMMTAYVVLQQHPLRMYENGPIYTITSSDVAQYVKEKSSGDSVVKVVAGDKWTELDMLEGLLLPSGDNMANILARWTGGNEQKFVAQMNQTAKHLGMTNTKFADASGVNPGSASTAIDQLKLAEAAMKNPVFRQIVGLPQANLPGAGIVYNVDYMVGHNGVIGIKTGSTPQAGGCFVSAIQDKVNGESIVVLGSTLGQQGVTPLDTAVTTSVKLAKQAAKVIKPITLQQGSVGGYIHVPWQGSIPLITTKTLTYLTFPSLSVTKNLNIVGNRYILDIQAGEQNIKVPLIEKQKLKRPSIVWRLLRGVRAVQKLTLF